MNLCIHNFEARYTEEENTKDINIKNNGGNCSISDESLKNLMVHKVYLFDICTKCGMKIMKINKCNGERR